jgi:hypothetical protein
VCSNLLGVFDVGKSGEWYIVVETIIRSGAVSRGLAVIGLEMMVIVKGIRMYVRCNM